MKKYRDMNENKTALITVCFGCSDADTFNATFKKLHEVLSDKYDMSYLAVSSDVIRDKLISAGVDCCSISDAISKAENDGIKNLYIVPLYAACGGEYDKLMSLIDTVKDRFMSVNCDLPLFRKYSTECVDIIDKRYPKKSDNKYLLVAHGSTSGDNSDYYALINRLHERGRDDMALYLSESDMVLSDIIKHNINEKITVVPLMFSFGHHMKSIKREISLLLKKEEYDIIMTSLAMMEEIVNLYEII